MHRRRTERAILAAFGVLAHGIIIATGTAVIDEPVTIGQLRRRFVRGAVWPGQPLEETPRTRTLQAIRRELVSEIRRNGHDLRQEIASIAATLRNEIRVVAEGAAAHRVRIQNHDVRLSRLESRR